MKTFCLTSNNGNSFLLKELHINLWLLKIPNQVILDVGFLLEVEKKFFFEHKNDSIRIQFFSPFDIKIASKFPFIGKNKSQKNHSITDLSPKIQNRETIEYIFNEPIEVHQFNDRNNPNSIYTLNIFDSQDSKSKRGNFIIAPITSNLVDCNRIDFQINDTMFIGDYLNREESSKHFSSDKINLYFRIRYNVNYGKTKNILIAKSLSHVKHIYDLRFNEVRLLPKVNGERHNATIKISNVMFFLIQSAKAKVDLQPLVNKLNVRLLEDWWNCHIEFLKLFKIRYLVYYWKLENINPSERMLISSEQDRINIKYDFNFLIIILIGMIINFQAKLVPEANVAFTLFLLPFVAYNAGLLVFNLLTSFAGSILASVLYSGIKRKDTNL